MLEEAGVKSHVGLCPPLNGVAMVSCFPENIYGALPSAGDLAVLSRREALHEPREERTRTIAVASGCLCRPAPWD